MPATPTKVHGKFGAIYLHEEKGTTGSVKVSNRTEWTLNLNRDFVDTTVFGDTNKTYLVGLKDISGTYAGILDITGDTLLDATESGALSIYLYADDTSTPPLLVAYGEGFFDASVTASNTDAVKITGNFRASGPWNISL